MQLNFQRHGEGFPLIILHGLFGSLDNWQNIARNLGQSFQVFTVDLRNHGHSPHHDDFNYAIMIEDLREFMATQQLPRAHVMGHSMGGKTAMHFALRHPEQVEKLIVVDMAPRAYAPAHGPIFKALLALNLGSFRERSEIFDALAPAIPEIAMRQFLVKNVMRDEAGTFRWKMNLLVLHRNYDELNYAIQPDRSFDGPVLFIKGEQSDYLAESDVALIHKLFPRTNMKTVAQAGHWVHAEAPEELGKMVCNFLR
jgi:esterase